MPRKSVAETVCTLEADTEKTMRFVWWMVAALVGFGGLLTLTQRRLIYLPTPTVPLITGELAGYLGPAAWQECRWG